MAEDLQYILDNMEHAVEIKSGRKPSGRPLLIFKTGAVRIEFFGNYKDITQAADSLRTFFNKQDQR